MAISVPLGLGAAMYLSEYAPDNRMTRLIRYGTEVLAGVPSIVFGLFGFALFVTALHFRFSILSGALTLACLLLPTLIRTSEEALRAVPRSHREAALALGATRWQTVWRVLLPAALPGIVTGIILSVGRAVGETACLFVTMGGSTAMPTSLFSGGRTLSMHLLLPRHGHQCLREGPGHRGRPGGYNHGHQCRYQLVVPALPRQDDRRSVIWEPTTPR